MSILIVEANFQHIEDISRICSIGWQQTIAGKFSENYQNETIDYWYSHDKIKSDIENGTYTHVALVGNKVVGTIGGTMTEDGASHVYVFYMDEVYRYQGIGRQLLEAFTNQHKELGATEQWVYVEEGNKLGIPFYEARGFQFQSKQTEMVDCGKERVTLHYKRKI